MPDPPGTSPRLEAARTAPSLSVSSASSLSRLLASSPWLASPSEIRTGSASEMSSESESLDRRTGGSGVTPASSDGDGFGRRPRPDGFGRRRRRPVVAALVDARTLLPLAPPRLDASCAFAVFAALADLDVEEGEKRRED